MNIAIFPYLLLEKNIISNFKIANYLHCFCTRSTDNKSPGCGKSTESDSKKNVPKALCIPHDFRIWESVVKKRDTNDGLYFFLYF